MSSVAISDVSNMTAKEAKIDEEYERMLERQALIKEQMNQKIANAFKNPGSFKKKGPVPNKDWIHPTDQQE